MTFTPSPFPVIPDVSPVADEQRAVLGHLVIARDAGEITDAEFDTFGQMLGLFGDHSPRTGHLKGDRRAIQHRAQGRGARPC